ncbi:MAG: hypothetical protein QW534_06615 [Candidatus Methanomethylicia archaeon]
MKYCNGKLASFINNRSQFSKFLRELKPLYIRNTLRGNIVIVYSSSSKERDILGQ